MRCGCLVHGGQGFKGVNDNINHLVGDEALHVWGGLVTSVVKAVQYCNGGQGFKRATASTRISSLAPSRSRCTVMGGKCAYLAPARVEQRA
jgi:hypothetical protein